MSLGSAIGKHINSGFIESGITQTGSRNSVLNNPGLLSGGAASYLNASNSINTKISPAFEVRMSNVKETKSL